MGDSVHHHHVVLDGIVIREPTVFLDALCDAGILTTPHDHPEMGGIRFRLVGLGLDAATYARGLPAGGSLVFDGVLIHSEPPGPDGACRGTYLGAGRAHITGPGWATGDPESLVAVIAFMPSANTAPLSVDDVLFLVHEVGSRIGLPLAGATPPIGV